MAEDKKQKKVKFPTWISPIGIGKYCWVQNPDKGFDGKGKPKFKARVVIEDTPEVRDSIQGFNDAIAAIAKKEGIKLKKVFHVPVVYPEDMDEDDFIPEEGKEKPKYDEDYRGCIYIEAKSDFKPGVIDAAKNELPDTVKVMSGDKIRLKVEGYAYEGLGSGISYRLKIVQLIEKNTTFSGGGMNVDDFDAVDGYVYEGGSNDDDEDDEIPF